MLLPNEIEFIVSQNDKGDNPKRPDYRGEVKIMGKVYELAAWKRTKQGTDRKFVSGKLKLKEPKDDPGAYQGDSGPSSASNAPASSHPGRSQPAPAVDPDEDVPF